MSTLLLKRKSGLTLLEMMLTIGILSIVMTAVFSVFMDSFEVFTKYSRVVRQQTQIIQSFAVLRSRIEAAVCIGVEVPNVLIIGTLIDESIGYKRDNLKFIVYRFGNNPNGKGVFSGKAATADDILVATEVKYDQTKIVNFTDNMLLNGMNNLEELIDAPNSSFQISKDANTIDVLVVRILPQKTNVGKFSNLNYKTPLPIQFSLVNKIRLIK